MNVGDFVSADSRVGPKYYDGVVTEVNKYGAYVQIGNSRNSRVYLSFRNWRFKVTPVQQTMSGQVVTATHKDNGLVVSGKITKAYSDGVELNNYMCCTFANWEITTTRIAENVWTP